MFHVLPCFWPRKMIIVDCRVVFGTEVSLPLELPPLPCHERNNQDSNRNGSNKRDTNIAATTATAD